MPGHTPVLLSEVLSSFQLTPGQVVIDATVGGGGHARAMLARIVPGGRLLGLEADPRTYAATASELRDDPVTMVHGNFRHLGALARDHGYTDVDAVLFDLGVSSMTVDDPARGFSFMHPGPLDMRFDPDSQSFTAADLVNAATIGDLTTIFRSYGEEPAASRVAAAIVERRRHDRFSDTADLADVVASVVRRRGPRHPATKVFQAIRMAVNDELGAIQAALPEALALLRSGGRLAVITFHSVEDRAVKRIMKLMAEQGQGSLVNKKALQPTRAEQLANRRARSAKLRIIQKK